MKPSMLAHVLLGVIPLLIVSCQRDGGPTLQVPGSDQTAEILVAAVSDLNHEDCQPLVHKISLGRLSTSATEELAKSEEFDEYSEILQQLQTANAKPVQIQLPGPAIAMLNDEEYQEVISTDDYLAEIVKIAPNACQITRVSAPVLFEKGEKAAVYIARARGRLSVDLHLLILRHGRDGWYPASSILILRA